MASLSLRYRISVAVLLVQGLLLGLMLWRVLTLTRANGYAHLAAAQSITLDLLEAPARQALLTAEYDIFQGYIAGLTGDPRIGGVMLVDDRQRIVASTEPAQRGATYVELVDGENRFWVRRVLSNAAGNLGVLAVEFSSEPVEQSYRDAWAEGVRISAVGLVVIAMISVSLGFLLTRRLDRLVAGAEQIALGQLDVATGVRGTDEVGRLGEVFDRMAGRIEENVAALQRHRDELEQRVTERTAELAAAKEEAEGLAELKSRFVSMASHEFRTPLTVIHNSADVLKLYSHKLAPEERVQQCEKILREVKHMTSLIEDVLTLGRADAGKLTFQPEMVDLRALCAELAAEATGAADRAAVVVTHRGGTAPVALDAALLRHILSNLLSNAIKFSAGDAAVELAVEQGVDGVEFRVSDHGIGIPPDDLARVFEPFHRGANSDTVPGTGLGLTVVKRAVDLHGGTIAVESTPARGTTVTVVLPWVQTEEA